jgi:hypothetical protein
MKLNLYVLTSKRIIWDSEVKEIILSTNSGQIAHRARRRGGARGAIEPVGVCGADLEC